MSNNVILQAGNSIPQLSANSKIAGKPYIGDCSQLANGSGKLLKGDDGRQDWYVCLLHYNQFILIKEDAIKPEGKSWFDSCAQCGRHFSKH